ncbi:hypothetical protein ABTM24_20345, partial [Acinetobacter baumannii]
MPTSPSLLLRNIASFLLVFIVCNLVAQEKSGINWSVKLNKSFNKTVSLGSQQVVLNNKFGSMD